MVHGDKIFSKSGTFGEQQRKQNETKTKTKLQGNFRAQHPDLSLEQTNLICVKK